MKPAELARLLGVHRQTIAKQISKNSLSKEWAQRIAPHLDVTPNELLFGPQVPNLKISTVPVLGETAAGRWVEMDYATSSRFSAVPAVPGRYESANQIAYLVVGDSMDEARILDGDYVICIPYFEARTRITNGDNVVVERTRGTLKERSCKQIEITGTGYDLVSRSSDPRHKEVIAVPRIPSDAKVDGAMVEIVGLVIGTFHPMI